MSRVCWDTNGRRDKGQLDKATIFSDLDYIEPALGQCLVFAGTQTADVTRHS